MVIDAINSGADFYLQKGGDPRAQFAELGHKIVQAVTHRQAEKALHKRIDLIRQTSTASTRFIRLPSDQIDAAIEQLLADLGSLTGADHCYIALGSEESSSICYTHEWASMGTFSLKNRIGTFPVADFSWGVSKIPKMEVINVPSLDMMPSEPDAVRKQKEWLQEIGIRSFLILPLVIGPTVIGSLGMDSIRKEMVWPEEDIDILKIYGQIIANALSRKAADRAIHDSEELYRTVFESTGTAMMVLGEDRIVMMSNREMERISGYTRSDIEGKIPWTQFVSSRDIGRMKHYHEMRWANPASVPKNYEFGFLARDGRTIDTYITVEMIPGTKKSIVSLIDISKEKAALQELADSEEKFRVLTASLAEGIYMIQDNRFIYVNPAFCRITGWSGDDLLALPGFTHLFPEEERGRVRKSVDDRLAGIVSSERYRVHVLHKNKTHVPVTVHGSLTRYKGKPAIIGTINPGDNS